MITDEEAKKVAWVTAQYIEQQGQKTALSISEIKGVTAIGQTPASTAEQPRMFSEAPKEIILNGLPKLGWQILHVSDMMTYAEAYSPISRMYARARELNIKLR